jgi:hypothetical protein
MNRFLYFFIAKEHKSDYPRHPQVYPQGNVNCGAIQPTNLGRKTAFSNAFFTIGSHYPPYGPNYSHYPHYPQVNCEKTIPFSFCLQKQS